MTSPGTRPGPILARFDPGALDRWTPAQRFYVDPDLCRRYAAATNEPNPRRWASGLAPPLLGVVATVPHVHTVLQRNVPERALAENRSVHGEHDIHYYQPLRPGSTLSVRGRLYGGQPKSTGTTLVTHVEMTDADTGRLVQVQYFVNFLRGVTIEEPLGEAPLAHRLPDAAILGMPAGTTTYHIDADQTYRYAEASGDHSIYHLDNAAARAAGFDGIIVHGLCTMALAGRVVVAGACEDDASRLRRLAVRFSRPMYPGRSMTTTLWAAPPDGDSPAEFRFQVADDQGAVVITDGLALVAPIGEEGTTR